MAIVVDPPGFDLPARIFDGCELRDVQTLIAQTAVKRLYVAVLRGFSGVNEVELRTQLVSPFLEHLEVNSVP